MEDEFQGGSGAGCSAVIFNSYVMSKLRGKLFKRVLFAATLVGSVRKVNPILLIVLSAVAGIAIYYVPTLFVV